MKDRDKTRAQLKRELADLRRRITELEELETKHELLEKELSVAYDALASSVNGVIITGLEGKIRYVNRTFLRMFEYEDEDEVIGKYAAELFASEKVQRFSDVQAIIDKVKGETEEFIARRKDGTEFNVEVSSSVVTDKEENDVGRMGSFIDISKRKWAEEYSERLEGMVEERTKDLRAAQEELICKEKLAILGQLAGGISHELRNPLGAIKTAVYFLTIVLEHPEPKIKETLGILEKEIGASERIISGLLEFARSKPPARRKVNINDIIQKGLSRVVLPETIDIVSQLDGAGSAVMADPDQLGQVFGNIILNAIQAMREGGQLVIKSEMEDEQWISISFVDTGIGIARENLGKIFEPLFTTKAKGIGLGLALVRALVEGHGGSIKVCSEVGKGSTFTVRLPVGGGKRAQGCGGAEERSTRNRGRITHRI